MQKGRIYSSLENSKESVLLKRLAEGELIFPILAQIDLTSKCNHSCVHCFYCGPDVAIFDREDFIPTDRMIRLLEEFAVVGITSIQYTGGGEPLLHKDIYDILVATIRANIGYSIVTNGVTIDLNRAKILGLAEWIRVSIDAATSLTYKRVHNLSDDNDFDKMCGNIKTLVKMFPKLSIGISFVVNAINYKEIVEAVEFAKTLGVSSIRFSVSYSVEGITLDRNLWSEVETLLENAVRLSTTNLKVYNLVSNHFKNCELKNKNYEFCGYQHFTAVIGSDSEVYPCCALKYEKGKSFGSLNDESFKSIWLGNSRRKWLNSNYLNVICNKFNCWMDDKNRFIANFKEVTNE